MIVGFTGTRNGMTLQQRRTLKQMLEGLAPRGLVHGACLGADDQADQLAADLGIPRLAFPSDMPNERVPTSVLLARGGSDVAVRDPQPPLERNRCVVHMSDLLVACPAQAREILRSGTWATVRHGRKLGRPVVVIEP